MLTPRTTTTQLNPTRRSRSSPSRQSEVSGLQTPGTPQPGPWQRAPSSVGSRFSVRRFMTGSRMGSFKRASGMEDDDQDSNLFFDRVYCANPQVHYVTPRSRVLKYRGYNQLSRDLATYTTYSQHSIVRRPAVVFAFRYTAVYRDHSGMVYPPCFSSRVLAFGSGLLVALPVLRRPIPSRQRSWWNPANSFVECYQTAAIADWSLRFERIAPTKHAAHNLCYYRWLSRLFFFPRHPVFLCSTHILVT